MAERAVQALVKGMRIERGETVCGARLDLQEMEQHYLLTAREKAAGNITRAARIPSVSRDTLRNRIEKYALKICGTLLRYQASPRP